MLFSSPKLTSAWNEHCVALSLDIVFVALGRQSHSVLTGMKLAVDLSTGPCQHLTGTQAENTKLQKGIYSD